MDGTRHCRTAAWLLGACVAILAAAPAAQARRHLIPAYFYPTASSPWSRMCDTLAGTGSTVVMNPNSGPGTAPNADYQRVIGYCRARGIRVIVYVHSSYGTRDAAIVRAEIDAAYTFYPAIDGIFIDEMSNSSSTRAYYQGIYAAIKAKPGVRDVVGNPGAAASTSWQLDTPVADEVVVFEGTAATYQRWSPPSWTAARPAARQAHLVYSTSTTTAMQQACSRARRLNGGWTYVTNDVLPNPWDTLPAAAYWNAEVAACP